MGIKLADLAQLVGGSLNGQGDIEITGASIIRDVQPGEISLIDRPELAGDLGESPAVAAVACEKFKPSHIPYILVEDVHASFTKIVQQFLPAPLEKKTGVHPAAHVADSAVIAEDTFVGPGAFIGEEVVVKSGAVIHAGAQIQDRCEIGEDSIVFNNAVLYERTITGKRCIFHSGCIIGAYGFGYNSDSGTHQLSAQLGNVVLEDDVEVGASSAIDRGTYGSTIIGEGTKIDNFVQIAHNCKIGKHNLLCAHVGIAGTTSTGDHVTLAGQVGVRDHVHIGENTLICAQSGVSNDVTANQVLLGAPAIPIKDKKIEFALLNKLPEIRRQVKKLLLRVDELEKENSPLKKAS